MKKIITGLVCAMFLTTATFAFAEGIFATKNGKKYHKEECPLIKNKNAVQITSEEARERGLTPCSKCFKDEAKVEDQKEKKIVAQKKSKKEKGTE